VHSTVILKYANKLYQYHDFLFIFTGDEVVAVTTMYKDPIASHSAELFRLHKFPSAHRDKKRIRLATD